MNRLAWLFITLPLLAQPETPIVLKAARLFDGKSDALLSPAMVVIAAGKVQRIGTSVEMPAGAAIIDLGDATLLPGLMDAHVHLSMEPG
jgi:imidazolonepropionase-like amidohydrolase